MGLLDRDAERSGVDGHEHDGIDPLVIIESICSCWVATSPLALTCSTVQSWHSSVIFFVSSGVSCVSQRDVAASGSSRPIFRLSPPPELLPASCPQAVRATAVEIAVMTTAAPRMQAFMRETSLSFTSRGEGPVAGRPRRKSDTG